MYYGWRIVGVSFVTLFISVGFVFYSYGVFFKALEVEFGQSRFAMSVGLSIMNIAMGAMAPFLGRLVDEWSIRKLMLIGACLAPLGFFAASHITALWQFFFLLATFLGVGVALIGQLPSSTLVSNWFIKRRGTALGIATMGISTSGLVMPPLSTWLIEEFGWRMTFNVYGVATGAIVLPLVYWLVVNRPQDMGLLPDNATPGSDEASLPLHASHPARNWTTGELIRERDFWAMTVSIALNFFCMSAVLIHMVPLATDLGYTAAQGAYVLSACAGLGVLGKVIFGWIADHIDTRIAFWMSMVFQAAGTVLILNAEESYNALLIAGAVFGLGMGGIVPLWGSMVGEVFGQMNFGRVMGLMSPCMLPIHVAGVPYAGLVFDQTHSYTIALKSFLGVYVVAALVLFALRRKDVDQRIKHELGIEEV